ncbi:MAG: haloacid dehalogenase-like hydrolase [Spirochaetales bacterium]|nr:haloacid dehalogenase-like hydrolase [Spirochaetales bacterium]
MADSENKPIAALLYDVDGTLSPGNMQEFSFIKALNMTADEFWTKCGRMAQDNDANSILCYMKLMLDEAKYRNIPITRKSFAEYGSQIELYPGVSEWFKLINQLGDSLGLQIEHYINSSGLTEMIEGSAIANEFRKIYACSFLYDANGVAQWPAVAVDFTTKTQFIFKINKGIDEISDSRRINEFVAEEDRRIPFKRMIYFGDGATDIPCMKMVKLNGGHSVAVYNTDNPSKQSVASKLILDNRVNFACPADYRDGSEMYQVVSTILKKIKSDYDFDELLKRHKERAIK